MTSTFSPRPPATLARPTRLGRLGGERSRHLAASALVFVVFSVQGLRYLTGLWGLGAICAVVIAWFLLTTLGRYRSFPRVPPLVVAFVALALLSTTWSVTAGLTLLATALLALTSLLGVVLGSALTPREAFAALYRGLQACLGVSIAFELVVAAIGRAVRPLVNEFGVYVTDSAGHAWSDNLLSVGGPIQGFVGNRNILGFIALLALILALSGARQRAVRALDAIITAACAIAVLVLTRSATMTISILTLVVLVLAAFGIRRVPQRWKRPVSWTFAGACVALAVVALKYREEVLGFFDRSPDFTNRTEIWVSVAQHAGLRPEGWGWVSYWPVWHYPYSDIPAVDGVPIFQAHNALLDAWLQLGIVGALLLLAMMLVLTVSIWRLVERGVPGDSVTPVVWMCLAAALILQSLTEARLLTEGNWVLFVALMTMVPSAIGLRSAERYVDAEPMHGEPSGALGG